MTLVFHIGYAKSGTTFLQRRFFPVLPKCNYIGRSYTDDGRGLENLNCLIDAVNGTDESSLHYARGRLIAEMRDGLNVISHEALLRSSNPFSRAARLAYIARGLDAKILITIRKQESIIWSRYVHDRTQLKHILPPYSLEKAIRPTGECGWPACRPEKTDACACLAASAKIIPLDYYDYHRIYNIYAEAFGDSRVSIIPLEVFHNARDFFGAMEDILDLRIGPSIRKVIDVHQPDNRAVAAIDLEHEKRRVLPMLNLTAHYQASNRALSRALGLNLERYGYMPSVAEERPSRSDRHIARELLRP